MSFSRPDPSSPTSIADASFGTSRRGFDQAEVKDFLRMVAAEFGRLRERERFLERELQAAQDEAGNTAAPVDDEAMTRLLGEEAMRVLTTARESANEIRQKAEQSAAQLLSEAGDEANRVREEADIEASRRRADAAADAEAELSMAKQQGREMVNEARAYRERVLSELARRRELAREQIEQLVHGRDRLMQAFERARLVAVDVVAEMQPLGEPDEYVNLTPTTGPLPVMIANSARPDDAAESDGEDDAIEVQPAVDHEVDAAETTTEVDVDGTSEDDVVAVAADVDVQDVVSIVSTDDVESDATATTSEATDEADVADVVDAADASELAEAADDTAADDADDADTGADDPDGDVVVDLFARLRADAPEEVADDEIAPADDVVPDEVGDETAAATTVSGVSATHEGLGTTDETDATGDAVADASTELGDVAATPFAERDEVVTPLIVSSAKRLKRALADEQNDVLDALRRGEAVHDLDTILPSIGDHVARSTAAIADDIETAVQFGGATSRTSNAKLRKALVAEAVGVANDAVEQWLVVPLRDRLERCIDEGAGDNAVVTKKVRAVYREWKTQHIDETLDDVLRRAYGRGVLAGFSADTPIVWEIDPRFPACPDCDDNALAGAVAAGDDFPTGDAFAPAHQGCRCLLVAADR